jgi:6-phospho-beta-glucosidase
MRKVTIIGGGGVRTPLLIYGLAQSQAALKIDNITLFDVDGKRLEIMARLCREVLRSFEFPPELRVETDLSAAAADAVFILNSVRVGGMAARARDERIAIEYGLAGQETTGPGGAAMALRTLPVTLAQAKIVEQVAPRAWFINFTNPAGLVTQALMQHTNVHAIGICDTPAELFHNIATALGENQQEMIFDYAGLNHLGWIRRVYLRGNDITDTLLKDTNLLRQLYSADLFDPALIQTLRLIPTEYLFFYYSQRRAHSNQLKAGASRGEELQRLNTELFTRLDQDDSAAALRTYRDYLIHRNSSYMKLEAQGGSVFSGSAQPNDPFETATGYHRIAVDVMRGLLSDQPQKVVVNVRNGSTIASLHPDDVIEVPCQISSAGPVPEPVGDLPESVCGLVQAVKAYERSVIRAALTHSRSEALLALLEYPIIGQWELAEQLLAALQSEDPQLAYLQ